MKPPSIKSFHFSLCSLLLESPNLNKTPRGLIDPFIEFLWYEVSLCRTVSFCMDAWTLYLKGLFHPACFARVICWFAFVLPIFMGHENGDNKNPTKRRHVQGILDETDLLIVYF